MKKVLSFILAAGMLSSVLLLSACNNEQSETNDNTSATVAGADTDNAEESKSQAATEAPENSTAADPNLPDPNLTEEQQREYMISHSLMTEGDTSRMVNVLKKAAAGEEITIGYIGGSITEGLTVAPSNPELCWAYLTYDALCKMYPDTKINYVNAGLSGTPSVLGVVRAERDLFADKNPDIIFIEFAVNDGQTQMYKDCYESLVKKSLEKENNPAVVLLFTVLKNKFTCQEQMSQIGEHYKLPMISVGNAINPVIDAGLMPWEKYSDDESHPNEWGHELVKDFVMNYFNKLKEQADSGEAPEITPVPDTALFSTEYSEVKLLERDQMNVTACEGFDESDNVIATFNNGWTYREKAGASIEFKAEFKTLFLVFKCNNSDSFADAEVYVDGEKVITLPSNKSGGWGNPEADLAWSGEGGEHTVKVVVPETEKVKTYGLCGIGVIE